jgi:serine protease Do
MASKHEQDRLQALDESTIREIGSRANGQEIQENEESTRVKQVKWYARISPVVVIALVALMGCMPQVAAREAAAPTATAAPPATPVAEASLSSGDVLAVLEGSLENIYAQVNPSVVNIQVAKTQEGASLSIPEIPGFPFRLPTPQGPQTQRGLGSGFVWDSDGHIVTNNHVVADADEITVLFADGTSVPAEIVGTDPDSDLAVLQIDLPADRLQPVQVADSTQVKVGELVVAIGNPFGLEGTMTVGFVSALGRSLPVQSADVQGARYTIPDVIQTDAPINPGNSGGVLVDDQGRVIGVTAAIESPVQANAGIGFAIPSAIVQQVVPALIESGHYEHPWLGISGTSLTTELNKAAGLDPDQRGVLVGSVTSGSPADKGGLKGSDRQAEIDGRQVDVGGDVIVAIDDQAVKDFDDLVTYLVRKTTVGQTVTLTVLRDGKEESLQIVLAARPKQEAQQSQPEGSTVARAWLGILGLSVTPEIAQAMDLAPEQQGILVEQVVRGSPADEADLRGSYESALLNGERLQVGGDVIVAWNKEPVATQEELVALLQQAEPGQEITLTLLREGKEVETSVTLAARPATAPVE